MIEFTIKSRDVEAVIARLQGKLADPSELMKFIATEMFSATESNFQRQSGPDGNWKPLALSTIRGRAKRGRDATPILQDGTSKHSLGLARSLQMSYTPTSARVGVPPNPYAAIHQFGGKAGPGKRVTIPARPYLPMRGQPGNTELDPRLEKTLLSDMMKYFAT